MSVFGNRRARHHINAMLGQVAKLHDPHGTSYGLPYVDSYDPNVLYVPVEGPMEMTPWWELRPSEPVTDEQIERAAEALLSIFLDQPDHYL